jgi:uncharacterized membrane protein YfcA
LYGYFAYPPPGSLLSVNYMSVAKRSTSNIQEADMRYLFLVLGFLLFLAWVGAFLVYHITGAMLHLLLIFALVFVVIHLFSVKRTA